LGLNAKTVEVFEDNNSINTDSVKFAIEIGGKDDFSGTIRGHKEG